MLVKESTLSVMKDEFGIYFELPDGEESVCLVAFKDGCNHILEFRKRSVLWHDANGNTKELDAEMFLNLFVTKDKNKIERF